MKQQRKLILLLAICIVALQHQNHSAIARFKQATHIQHTYQKEATPNDFVRFPATMLWDF